MTPSEAVKHLFQAQPLRTRGNSAVALLIAFTEGLFQKHDDGLCLHPVEPLATAAKLGERLPYANLSQNLPDLPIARDELAFRAKLNATAAEQQHQQPWRGLDQNHQALLHSWDTSDLTFPEGWQFSSLASHSWMRQNGYNTEWSRARRALLEAISRLETPSISALMPLSSFDILYFLSIRRTALLTLHSMTGQYEELPLQALVLIERVMSSAGIRCRTDYSSMQLHEWQYGHVVNFRSLAQPLDVTAPLRDQPSVSPMCRVPLYRLRDYLYQNTLSVE